jgi:hypothetical protein
MPPLGQAVEELPAHGLGDVGVARLHGPSSWPISSSMSLPGVPSSSMSVLNVCRSPCGVSPVATGTQQASARPAALRPRTGTPGPVRHGGRRSAGQDAAGGGIDGGDAAGQPDQAGAAGRRADVAQPGREVGAGSPGDRLQADVNRAGVPRRRGQGGSHPARHSSRSGARAA